MALGILLLCLAVLSLVGILFIGNPTEPISNSFPIVGPPPITDVLPPGSGTESILEVLQFQKAHHEFQQSYLNLMQKIGSAVPKPIDIKEQRLLYSEYSRSARKYREVMKKLVDYQKDSKLRCFAQMKSLILGILYYDKKHQKKMSKFDPQKLLEEGALKEIPRCPNGGEYMIIFRDNRRHFRCSLHGNLRQN